MQYIVNFHPICIKGDSKLSVHIKATSGHTRIFGGGREYDYNGYSRTIRTKENEYIRVINYKKHRRVTKHDKKKKQ